MGVTTIPTPEISPETSLTSSAQTRKTGPWYDFRRQARCFSLTVLETARRIASSCESGAAIDKNSARRQMTESQNAMVGARIANLKKGGDRKSGDFKASLDALITEAEAAKMTGSSRASVQRAKTVIENGVPELSQSVDSGKLSVNMASSAK